MAVGCGGVAAGASVGVVASRMTRLEWVRLEQRVECRMDVVGVVVLLAYIVFSLFRSRIVGLWVPAA
ncbi:hypothetical protein JOL79_20045 [Microbispora sp. RL4-1S]|uniref:Uncharacterized protein n=1 Tax=Microbispora oryzae TaxID=2806554 RepID=A0A940WS93_9ACTN|nr:hypothetical protein [Microbispora oryzae]MBP2706104.1 hypothetical protein [Microbispora oryzae]